MPALGNIHSSQLIILLLLLAALMLFIMAFWLKAKADRIRKINRESHKHYNPEHFRETISAMNKPQIQALLQALKKNTGRRTMMLLVAVLGAQHLFAQDGGSPKSSLFAEGGILITIALLSIPVIAALILMVLKITRISRNYENKRREKEAAEFAAYLKSLPEDEIAAALEKRKLSLDYRLSNTELSGEKAPEDPKGLLQVKPDTGLPFVAIKRKAIPRAAVAPELSKLVIWYLIAATFWLLFGTTVGEYVGIKFVAPDADHVSWLSFGRLRPVHTNAVFWGWASLGMLGLGHYVVARVGNNTLYSYRLAWVSLWLINLSVIIGSILLMAGINNSGGEYREYIWPVMLLFGIGLILTLYNFMKTIARRKTKEIYISNWYMVSAIIFTLVIAFVAYWPSWQNGLGETIAQGYYMHQGVGMWFMLFTLGLVYYYLPQQLNKPIYSYSLGILAFWTQILFYTLIGSHHFVFSSIPWWLQTVAIFGSVGMVIPVVAGTTNFLMTFKNGWYKLTDSYTLPFFLVGIIFYFTGSLQGTAEAFRSTNLMWHFTDFTVAHSHLTMYGIISFFVWACTYTIIPRMTHKEAPQLTIGTHFWLALIGLLFYTVPLMYGSTLKGLMWMEGKPFIEGVVFMAPYWLWRAIGGSLMWISHIFFAYNLYRMIGGASVIDVKDKVIELLHQENEQTSSTQNPNK